MTKPSGLRRAKWIALAAAALGTCVGLAEGSAKAGETTEYSWGVVPQFAPARLIAAWRPILDRVGDRTGFRFRLVGAPQIPNFEVSFMEGRFDFAYMNPLHAMFAMRRGLYLPLVRDRGKTLQGILVVRRDGAIRSVEDLREARVAYPAPNALGASLVVRSDLLRNFGVRTDPLYVRTHSSVYLHVALGLTAAGGGVQTTLDRQPPEVRKRLRVLYRSDTFSPHPVMAHRRVAEAHREKVRAAFLELGRSESGRALLAAIPMSRPTRAVAEDYLALATMDLEKLMAPLGSVFRETAEQARGEK
ncbi:MAG: phosphate/phosphite/phosphonate ABC transporter substrate-binding protein [Alphaproteobacteria bacterium]|nr:phosphate/phosphite/phosphonate ABC transporter substrate-binding protein [Alphaproteobacteria bacterium]